MPVWAILMGFMRNTYKFFTGKLWRTISLGTLCAIGAFAAGMQTSGNIHPFARSEAALQELFMATSPLKGDVNGNGTIDSNDAYLLYEITTGLQTATQEQVRTGDTDGDGLLTEKDLGVVLHKLSIQ